MGIKIPGNAWAAHQRASQQTAVMIAPERLSAIRSFARFDDNPDNQDHQQGQDDDRPDYRDDRQPA